MGPHEARWELFVGNCRGKLQEPCMIDSWLPNTFVDRLWEDGWKGRYYTNKFGVSQDDEEFDGFRNKVVSLVKPIPCLQCDLRIHLYLWLERQYFVFWCNHFFPFCNFLGKAPCTDFEIFLNEYWNFTQTMREETKEHYTVGMRQLWTVCCEMMENIALRQRWKLAPVWRSFTHWWNSGGSQLNCAVIAMLLSLFHCCHRYRCHSTVACHLVTLVSSPLSH